MAAAYRDNDRPTNTEGRPIPLCIVDRCRPAAGANASLRDAMATRG